VAGGAPAGDPDDASLRDNVSGLSFCDEGTRWVASGNHGIGRFDPATGAWKGISAPSNYGNAVTAIAGDPADGSVWVGFAHGGFGRVRNDQWDAQSYVPATAPSFTWNPVRAIQIDRWATPRIVCLARAASAKHGPGGVTVYTAP
jgi:streptogramin lyase